MTDANAPAPRETPLRGCKAIATYYYNDAGRWRKINRLCVNGRFPHFREGSVICAYRSVIEDWIWRQQVCSMGGRTWRAKDVKKHFGDADKGDKPCNDSPDDKVK